MRIKIKLRNKKLNSTERPLIEKDFLFREERQIKKLKATILLKINL